MSLAAKLLLPSNLYNTLSNIQKTATKEIYCLNFGGCGVFAVAIAKELQKRNIPCEIITVAYSAKSSPSNVKSNLLSTKESLKCCDAWDSNGLGRNHVGVRFKYNGITFTYDSDAIRRSVRKFGQNGAWECNYPYGEGMSTEDMKKLVEKKHGWNSDFDRRQITTVKKIVKEAFKNNY